MLDRFISECSDYDFKLTLDEEKPKHWLKTISAFANGLGGTIFFGVSNDRRIVGVLEPQIMSERITTLINTRIKPIPRFLLKPIIIEGKIVLEVKVYSGLSTPFYYEVDGKREAYVRSGSSTKLAPSYILNELILKGTNQSFDAIISRYKKTRLLIFIFRSVFFG